MNIKIFIFSSIRTLDYPDYFNKFEIIELWLYQALVKYLLTETFSFQVRANEDFNDPWIKLKGVHQGKRSEVRVSITRVLELQFRSLFNFNLIEPFLLMRLNVW